jgi:hypothetical protein
LRVEGNRIVFASVHWGGRYCEDTNMDVDPWVHWGSDNPTDPVDPSQSVSIVNGSFTVHEEDGYGGPTDPNGGYHYEQTLTGTFDGGRVTGTIRRTDTQYAYDSYAGAASRECDSGPVPWSATNAETALIACQSAQAALEKAEAKLARLRKQHASKATIKKAKKQVKAAKQDVEGAC